MKKKQLTILLVALFAISNFSIAQQSVRMNAVKANNYGVMYSLPKTSIEISFKIKKTTYNRGEFYQFAQRYLNIAPITENKVEYSIEDVMVNNIGVPDTENTFMVIFKSNTYAPYVYLTKDGLICAINDVPDTYNVPSFDLQSPSSKQLNAKKFLSEETLAAGSTIKQAELVSRQIFDLRRSRNDILMGEAENMPPDGEAYKVVMEHLNMQEKALTEMFVGYSNIEYLEKKIVVNPTLKDIDKLVIARFSKKLGMVDADNLAGEPIYVSLINKLPHEEIFLSDRDKEKLEKKLSEGVVYNIPGKGQLTIMFDNKIQKDMEIDVVQFGSQDVLTKKMFDNMKQPIKIKFYQYLGAIKQIVQ